MVGQLNRCLLFLVSVGSEAECIIEWYTITTLHETPVMSSVQKLLKGLGTNKRRASIEGAHTKYCKFQFQSVLSNKTLTRRTIRTG